MLAEQKFGAAGASRPECFAACDAISV